MLRALELAGFKSFADRTRFEFPPGITVVVGPNGSGKSNVVDAIKWVLGEQSVKSLRGKEMADCIFNGSAARRPLNAAETTLLLDNTSGRLAIDATEVAITRRVYRSGEGEYLINRQPCRLRDIRDLFAGTGLSTEAYSVIEQGKVDVLLQSSPRERRLIFEEAAGISRFKAKKVEALRRLERVEQNLLRLSDIVDEVDSRLRGVRIQAGKARKYKEYAERLQALRTQIGLADWRTLTEKLTTLDAEVQAIRDENAQALAHLDVLEAQSLSIELQMAASDAATRSFETRLATNREQIAKRETTVDHQRRRSRDLEDEISRYRQQLSSMTVRAGDLTQQIESLADSLRTAAKEHKELTARLGNEEQELAQLTAQSDARRAENEQVRGKHLGQMKAVATLGNQTSNWDSKVAQARTLLERGGLRLAEISSARNLLSPEVQNLRTNCERLSKLAEEQQAELAHLQNGLATLRKYQAQINGELGPLRERHSGVLERAAVLDELDKRHEGLGDGVKQVLAAVGSDDSPAFRQVRGMVADLLSVSFEAAPLVEVALGEMAHYVVVADSSALADDLQQGTKLDGRVAFLCADAALPKSHLDNVDLHGLVGVVGRGDEFVQTADESAPLARRLLGKTWMVESLDDALRLAGAEGRGLSFVTRGGELLAADGTLHVGPRHMSSGIISRRSQLRELQAQIAQTQTLIEERLVLVRTLEQQLTTAESQVRTTETALRKTSDQFAHERLRRGAADSRLTQLEEQYATLTTELATAENDRQRAESTLASVQTQFTAAEQALVELENLVTAGAEEAAKLEQVRARASRSAGTLRIEVAKCEQQLAHFETQRAQLQRDQMERGKALFDGKALLAAAVDKLRLAERDILRAESELSELYLHKENFAAEAADRVLQRQEWREMKTAIAGEEQKTRNRIRKLEAKLHAKELAAGEVSHERTTLADRLREDYAIELAELEHVPSAEELQERTVVEREIAELRGKLNSIGGVNLDALAELDELEARFATLSNQHADLKSAKASLEQIIGKINADSRRLFAATFEVVRGHFQSLFRKLFGGGQADLILDEGADILDSGIEIVARPPGKEPRSISLLSGGEKTMACVALLLAIFRSRPSPFCVLDEVDAALDESNIERFMSVLHEFLDFTQFIVVTHSKKTMSSANTLYGVTMQESGVSKRVSVRFQDVAEDGQIVNVRDSEPRADNAAIEGEPGETQAA